MRTKKVLILRSDNRIVLDPTTPRIKAIIAPKLTYTQKIFFRGYEKKKRRDAGLPIVEEQEWECFGEDHKGRLGTSFGFKERITETLENKGYEVKSRWATKSEREKYQERLETVYKPHWDRIEALLKSGFKYRYKQKRCLEIIAQYENGRIDCHGGWGKGTEIMLGCMLFAKAKIAVVTKRVPILLQRLYPELALNLPSVGIVCGGKKIKGRRVMCYSADSLHHADGDEDIVFVDEGHEACADKFAESMGKFDHARLWSFSASWDMRSDNKDLRGEAIFGPIRIRVPYKTGVKHGLVVPIVIIWRDVNMDVDPCGDLEDTDKLRAGVWANDYRNSLIAKDARMYDDDTQTLITVETLEHALYLKQLLPDYTIVYSGDALKHRQLRNWQNAGLLYEGFKLMTPERKDRLTDRFSRGRLKKVIVTPCWNVGVNFRYLQVLIRADGSGSAVNGTQIPCRNARPHLDGWDKKMVAIVHDYRDQFNNGCRIRATNRAKTYEKNEWKQYSPDKDRKTLLRKLMGWSK